MATVGVIGLGNWGTALANHLSQRGHNVLGWCREPEIAESINSHNKNPHYLPAVTLHHGLKATNNLEEASCREVVLLGFPSQFLSSMLPKIKPAPGAIVISIIKGLDAETLSTPLECAARHLSAGVKLAVLSGPSFARDVVVGKPCGLTAASKDEAVARQVAEIFASDRMRVYVSTDTVGVEIGGVVKNVIALAAGVCDGLELGDSARAGLITRGLAEIMRLAKAMGAEMQTLSGLSGLGDLVMTASCDTSRNRTVGLRLGRGEKLEYILSTLGSIAEAVKTTPLVLSLAAKHGVDMPISLQVSKLLKGESTPAETVENLLLRPIKREF